MSSLEERVTELERRLASAIPLFKVGSRLTDGKRECIVDSVTNGVRGFTFKGRFLKKNGMPHKQRTFLHISSAWTEIVNE